MTVCCFSSYPFRSVFIHMINMIPINIHLLFVLYAILVLANWYEALT